MLCYVILVYFWNTEFTGTSSASWCVMKSFWLLTKDQYRANNFQKDLKLHPSSCFKFSTEQYQQYSNPLSHSNQNQQKMVTNQASKWSAEAGKITELQLWRCHSNRSGWSEAQFRWVELKQTKIVHWIAVNLDLSMAKKLHKSGVCVQGGGPGPASGHIHRLMSWGVLTSADKKLNMMYIYIYIVSTSQFWRVTFDRFLASVVYNAADGQVQEVTRMTKKQVGSIKLFHQTDP